MIRTKKIAILAIIAMVFTMMPAALFAADSNRLAGADRISTAIAIADAGWEEADTVVLAPADQANLVDALAAAPLAGQEDAPILLTFKGSLNADVKAKIEALGASTVYVVGAISDEVTAEVDAIDGVTAEALKGASRWATADAINAKLVDPAGSFVVGYNAIADALSAASFAAANGYAIVLTQADGTVDEDDLLGDVTYLVGGTGVVADYADADDRFGGADRFATNRAVAAGLDFSYDKVYVANGLSMVDALAVAPLAAQGNAFVLLSAANSVTGVDGITASTEIIAVGGTGAVPNSVVSDVYDAGGTFEVVSVESANLIQVVIELSNDNYYDEDELKDEGNYEFEGEVNGSTGTEVAVEEAVLDGTTLTLNLNEEVDNQTVGELVIDSAVTGDELVFEDIEFFDKEIPSVESATVIGEDTVKVVFSEPINFYSNVAADTIDTNLEDEFEFELDGKSYSVDAYGPTENDTEVNVQVYGKFTEGELTLTVGNGLEDYAGFNVAQEVFTLDVTPDSDAPEVTGYKDADRDEVTLVFNEAVRFTGEEEEEDFYHTNDDDYVKDIATQDGVVIDDNEVTLSFAEANELPEGTAYVYIKSGALEDLWGNENSSIRVKVEIDLDEAKPTVKEIEVTDTAIEITFSEELDEGSAEDEDNYVVVDPDGDEVSIRVATYSVNDDDEGVVTLDPRETPLDDGTYEITINDVEDVAGNEMDKYSADVELEDSNAPSFATFVYVDEIVAGDEYELFVEFDEELATSGQYAATDLFKYEIAGENLGEADDDSDDGIKVELDMLDGNKTAKITIEGLAIAIGEDANGDGDVADPGDTDGDALTVGRIADLDGNYTGFSTVLETVALTDRSIGFDTVKATGKKTIEVKFDGNLDDYDVDDFFVFADDDTVNASFDLGETLYDIESIDVVDANEIIITMDSFLPTDTEVDLIYLATEDTLADIDTENAFGAKLAADITEIIVDKIDPQVLENDNVNTDGVYGTTGNDDDVQRVYASYDGTNSEIVIEFSEEVLAIAKNLVEVYGGGDELTVETSNVATNVLTIEVTEEVFKGDNIDIAIVTDTEGNSVLNLALEIEYKVELSIASAPAVTLTNSGTIAGGDVQYATAAAVIAALPTSVTVTLEGGTTASVPVTWADTDTYNAAAAASYDFTATFGAYPNGVNNDNAVAAPVVTVVVAP